MKRLLDEGQYIESPRRAEQALELAEIWLGPDHPETASGANNLGKVYVKNRQYERALPLLQRALAIREKVLGPEHVDTAVSTNELGFLYYDMGKYDQALPILQRALAIREEVLGPKHLDTARSLFHLSLVYVAMSQRDRALPFLQRALATFEIAQGSDHRGTAFVARYLGKIYFEMGQYDHALPLFQRSLAIDDKVLEPDDLEVASSAGDLGYLYYNIGQYDRALPLLGRALAIFEKVRGPVDLDTTRIGGYLAMLYTTMGQYDRALPLFERSLAISEKVHGPVHHDVAAAAGNLGQFYVGVGQYDRALPLLERSLAISEKVYGSEHYYSAIGANNLAQLFFTMGQYDHALPLLKRALAILEKVGGLEHPTTTLGVNNLGTLYTAMGQYDRALPLLKRSLAISEKIEGPEHPLTGNVVGNLGVLHHKMGESDIALSYFEREFAISLQHPLLAFQSNAGERLCAFYRDRGQAEIAIFYCKFAVNQSQRLRQNARALKLEAQRALTSKLEPLYQMLAKLLIQEGKVAEAEQVLGMHKENEFYEYVRRSESKYARSSRAGFNAEEQGLADSLEVSARELSRIYSERERLRKITQPTVEQQQQLVRFEEQKRVENERLIKLFNDIKQQLTQQGRDGQNQQAQQLVESKGATEGMLKTLRQMSLKEPVLVYYLPADKNTLFLIHTREGLRQIQGGLGEVALNEKIVHLRQAIQGKEEYRKLAGELYQALITPIEPYLKQESHLMLYLTDALRYLPFAALYDSRSKQHLIQKHSLSVYTHVGRDKLDKQPEQQWSAVGLGTSQKTPNHSALPWVVTELKRVVREAQEPRTSGVIPGKRYLDNKFSHDLLMSLLNPESAQPVMHVATHFTLAPGNDNDSALVLGNGDVIKLSEIAANAQLSGYDLITLSACETALGADSKGKVKNVAAGAEVEGLGALLQRQGAKAVLATLWKVEDTGTAYLMEQFYKARGENRKTTKAQALRQAQRALLTGKTKSEGKHDLRHPYYWASFILMGNWL